MNETTHFGVELVAGRELDAAVAAALGLPLEPPCPRYHATDEANFDTVDGAWYGWCYTCGRSIQEVEPQPKRYSRDIAAAWEVVERMAEEDLSVVIATNGAAPRQNGVKVFDSIHGLGREIFEANAHPGWYAVAETVPLAICSAALRALASLTDGAAPTATEDR